MEVALYMRVSTTRQQQHQTIEQQLSRLHAYVAHATRLACRRRAHLPR